jgi:hypothetical protein
MAICEIGLLVVGAAAFTNNFRRKAPLLLEIGQLPRKLFIYLRPQTMVLFMLLVLEIKNDCSPFSY